MEQQIPVVVTVVHKPRTTNAAGYWKTIVYEQPCPQLYRIQLRPKTNRHSKSGLPNETPGTHTTDGGENNV